MVNLITNTKIWQLHETKNGNNFKNIIYVGEKVTYILLLLRRLYLASRREIAKTSKNNRNSRINPMYIISSI